MTVAWNVRVGEARIQVTIDGCIDCGTLWSSGWHVAKHVFVKIGSRQTQAHVYRCDSCQKKQEVEHAGQTAKEEESEP